MPRYLITYDLHKERDYEKLFDAIKEEYHNCWHKPVADVIDFYPSFALPVLS